VGKVLIVAVTPMLLATVSCHQLEVEDSPVVSMVFTPRADPTPPYLDEIGVAASVMLLADL
jgi:hypothetical protein